MILQLLWIVFSVHGNQPSAKKYSIGVRLRRRASNLFSLTNLQISIDLIAYERRKGNIALLATCNPAAPNLGLPSTLLLPNFACWAFQYVVIDFHFFLLLVFLLYLHDNLASSCPATSCSICCNILHLQLHSEGNKESGCSWLKISTPFFWTPKTKRSLGAHDSKYQLHFSGHKSSVKSSVWPWGKPTGSSSRGPIHKVHPKQLWTTWDIIHSSLFDMEWENTILQN